jgi:hypothetical protein
MSDDMTCRICGKKGDGLRFSEWVRPTFTNWDKLYPGDIICHECLFWFNEKSEELAARVGKDKPQRMRNYSHFLVDGEWKPLSKAEKVTMRELLLSSPFPELAVIAESGQKHIAFRARRNHGGSDSGWVQFEEQAIFIVPRRLASVLDVIESLYISFAKSEIETGRYAGYRIMRFGLEEWNRLEDQIKEWRGSMLFRLALFLAQKKETTQ